MPNRLSQFWQELKRRNVVRVVTVYAASVFVVLELVDIITEPFGLPDWTLKLVVVLFAVGLIVAIIVSWVYDIHPEGGMVKTKLADKVKQEDKPKSSSGWKIASYVSFVVIAGLIILNVIPRVRGKSMTEVLDKSIAVLPFINDSPDKNNEHIINGIMEDLLINLQSINGLRVPGRTSTEQYRNNPKPIPEIATEMNVAYIVEGSGQRYGDRVRLRVQLVEGVTDKHIWAAAYDEVINGPEDIFRIQSQLAKSIATELHAVITPDELNRIENVSTTNLTAYDYYQRGKYELYHGEDIELSEKLFRQALEYDSTFAEAYSGLAIVYMNKYNWEDFFSTNFLDTVIILADRALHFNPHLPEAFFIKGAYYNLIGDADKAMLNLDQATIYNPNYGLAYALKGNVALAHNLGLLESIKNIHMAINLERDEFLSDKLFMLGHSLLNAGFTDKARQYYLESFKLEDEDSLYYYYYLGNIEGSAGNYNEALEYNKKGYQIDSLDVDFLYGLAANNLSLGRYEESLYYFIKWMDELQASEGGNIDNMQRVAYVYLQNGMEEEADYYLDLQLEYCNKAIELQRTYATNLNVYYDLAEIYSLKGEIVKALEYLRIFSQSKVIRYWRMVLIKNDPLFENIRDEPEFHQIILDLEAKYQAEHERVRQWLDDNDMF